MTRYRMVPSDTRGAVLAMEIVGIGNINAGSWLSSVFVFEVPEMETVRELLKEQGYELVKE